LDINDKQKYWVLKTREGRGGHDYWYRFVRESVIAIGWQKIKIRPSTVNKSQLKSFIKQAYPGENEQHGACTIIDFIRIRIEDKILLCQGYSPNQIADVYIYGFATVTSSFYDDALSDWWSFKHKAHIQLVEKYVPKRFISTILGKQSMLQTLHEIKEHQFEQFKVQLTELPILKGGEMAMYNEADIQNFVDNAIKRSGLKVTQTARQILIDTGLEGKQHIQTRYHSKKEAESEILPGLIILLKLAMTIANNNRRDVINDSDINKIMNSKCPIKPWC
jgi:hypothetical protein